MSATAWLCLCAHTRRDAVPPRVYLRVRGEAERQGIGRDLLRECCGLPMSTIDALMAADPPEVVRLQDLGVVASVLEVPIGSLLVMDESLIVRARMSPTEGSD